MGDAFYEVAQANVCIVDEPRKSHSGRLVSFPVPEVDLNLLLIVIHQIACSLGQSCGVIFRMPPRRLIVGVRWTPGVTWIE
jgi:hypothetical protein